MKLELCAASVEAITLARKYKFNRIELCQNLENGGTTPSLGMIQYAIEHKLETHVLIRQRAGDFVYSDEEKKVMLTDVKRCNLLGVKGLVVGLLTKQKQIDVEPIIQMIQSVSDIDFTFHRAFDDIENWKPEMEILIELGFKRILTSGGASTVEEGKQRLKEIIQHANGRIEIMIGGGITAQNISSLVSELQPNAVHFSGTTLTTKTSNDSLFSSELLEVNEENIKNILQYLKQI